MKVNSSDVYSILPAGNFGNVSAKLRELASGVWDGRNSLQRHHIQEDAELPVKKAIVSGDDRILWNVHCAFDAASGRAMQVLKSQRYRPSSDTGVNPMLTDISITLAYLWT